MDKKKLMYAAVVFIVSFALTYTLIKKYKKQQNKETIEKIK
ncbi:hypothetical protein [Flavobacterium piscis]|uniref:Membrane protein n=1 Tax=Flavobacterium piscis TaxID=1114874 RepID=A0ABU1Y9N5_9FLAO|nr:hypothetical protein [Flavobacterium piscis]MDR7210944.1 putative membrane protein [Flavobacterium piscis]